MVPPMLLLVITRTASILQCFNEDLISPESAILRYSLWHGCPNVNEAFRRESPMEFVALRVTWEQHFGQKSDGSTFEVLKTPFLQGERMNGAPTRVVDTLSYKVYAPVYQ